MKNSPPPFCPDRESKKVSTRVEIFFLDFFSHRISKLQKKKEEEEEEEEEERELSLSLSLSLRSAGA